MGVVRKKPAKGKIKTRVEGGEAIVRISQDMDFLDPHKAVKIQTT